MAARQSILTSSRLFLTGFALSAALLGATPYVGVAQDLTQPQVDNAKHSFEGLINSNAVFIRSGPSESFYPTMKLDKGAKVKVVGIKYNWLKIEPPAGAFSYVSQAYIQRRGDGSVGRVINGTINVRAGSDLNAMKTTVQTKLEAGQDVKILGTQDEYYKIAPPDGAYLFVDQRFVEPVRRLDQPIADGSAPTPDGPVETITPTLPGANDQAATEPASRPTGTGELVLVKPTTKPAAGDAQAKWDELENKFQVATGKPVAEQPVDDLLAGYQALSTAPGINAWLKQATQARVAALKLRKESRDEFVALQTKQAEARQRQQALAAEHEELQERIKQSDVKIFTAVGTLRTSSLQIGAEPLYRLTDPETGRTVVYVRSSDGTLPGLINSFAGISGTLTADTQLNLRVIVDVTGAEAVDQTKVNGSVAAQVVPPSLLPRVPTADAAREGGNAVEPR